MCAEQDRIARIIDNICDACAGSRVDETIVALLNAVLMVAESSQDYNVIEQTLYNLGYAAQCLEDIGDITPAINPKIYIPPKLMIH
jgi:hypothetical protein